MRKVFYEIHDGEQLKENSIEVGGSSPLTMAGERLVKRRISREENCNPEQVVLKQTVVLDENCTVEVKIHSITKGESPLKKDHFSCGTLIGDGSRYMVTFMHTVNDNTIVVNDMKTGTAVELDFTQKD